MRRKDLSSFSDFRQPLIFWLNCPCSKVSCSGLEAKSELMLCERHFSMVAMPLVSLWNSGKTWSFSTHPSEWIFRDQGGFEQ